MGGWLYWTVWIFAGLAIIEALQQGDATGLATARLANQCHNLSKLLRCISLTQAKLLNHGKIPKKKWHRLKLPVQNVNHQQLTLLKLPKPQPGWNRLES